MKKPTWEKEFDDEFEGMYFGKDDNGDPEYPSHLMLEEVKHFIGHLIEDERDKLLSECFVFHTKVVDGVCEGCGKKTKSLKKTKENEIRSKTFR